MEYIIAVALGVALLISIYININLLRKNEAYEDSVTDADSYVFQMESWVKELQKRITEANRRLKEIDRKGSFESDDEVGFFFRELKQIMDNINDLTTQE